MFENFNDKSENPVLMAMVPVGILALVLVLDLVLASATAAAQRVIGCSSVLILFGGFLWFLKRKADETRRFAAIACRTSGEVVDTWVEDGETSTSWISVRFIADGDPVYFSALGGARIGTIVDVFYDPANPEDARLSTEIRGLHAIKIIIYGLILMLLTMLFFG
jgi:Protein of unknown function (DUF3592)